MLELLTGIFTLIVIASFFLFGSFFIINQWENGVILRFGKIKEVKQTGLHFRVPLGDMRTQTLDMNEQSAITKDNISVGIDAVVFMTIEDPRESDNTDP